MSDFTWESVSSFASFVSENDILEAFLIRGVVGLSSSKTRLDSGVGDKEVDVCAHLLGGFSRRVVTGGSHDRSRAGLYVIRRRERGPTDL